MFENEEDTTRVIFRMTPRERLANGGLSNLDPECVAFLLDVDAKIGYVMSYMHVGQHGEASVEWMYSRCIPATPEQYADLKAELESIGYILKIRTRWQGKWDKAIEACVRTNLGEEGYAKYRRSLE